jgi:hypothetical protein
LNKYIDNIPFYTTIKKLINTIHFHKGDVMTKAQSDTQPANQVQSRGKTQVNFNIEQVEITDDMGTRQVWQYEYVEVEGKVTKSKVLAAMDKAQLEVDTQEWTPQEVATQFDDSKSKLKLSDLTGITYAQLDTYIDNNITDLPAAKVYLKKLSAVVLALVKKGNPD